LRTRYLPISPRPQAAQPVAPDQAAPTSPS
jgi:hypothetical protein